MLQHEFDSRRRHQPYPSIKRVKVPSELFLRSLGPQKKDKRSPDNNRLRRSPVDAPTPAGEQSNGDPAATQVAMRLRDCLRKAWASKRRAIIFMLVNKRYFLNISGDTFYLLVHYHMYFFIPPLLDIISVPL